MPPIVASRNGVVLLKSEKERSSRYAPYHSGRRCFACRNGKFFLEVSGYVIGFLLSLGGNGRLLESEGKRDSRFRTLGYPKSTVDGKLTES